MWAADPGCWDAPAPGWSPALRQTPRAASSASPAAGSSEGKARQGQRGSHRRCHRDTRACSPPRLAGTTAGAGREHRQPARHLRGSPGRWRGRPSSHPIQLPGWRPAPRAGPPLHKHHLAARLVLVLLALPRIYHPARSKQGIKALPFTARCGRAHPQHSTASPRPPFVPPIPGLLPQVLLPCPGRQHPGEEMSQTSCVV